MLPELSRNQWILIIVIYCAAVIIARFSIGILRRREWFLSILLLLVLSAGAAYALSYYRSIHAPEIIAEKARVIGHNLTHTIDNKIQKSSSKVHGIAGSYTINYDDEHTDYLNKADILPAQTPSQEENE